MAVVSRRSIVRLMVVHAWQQTVTNSQKTAVSVSLAISDRTTATVSE